MTPPLKPFDFADCHQLISEGYAFFGTDFRRKKNEDYLVLYPFKKEMAAITFSQTDNGSESFVLKINDDLESLTHQVSHINIYLQLL